MLPAFPQIERLRATKNLKIIHDISAKISPLLGSVQRHILYEGNQNRIDRYDKTHGGGELRPVSAEVKIGKIKLEDFNEERLLEFLEAAADQIAFQAITLLFSEFDKTTAETGNIFDGGGKPLDEDMILEMLDKMEHSFTPDGTWEPPTMVVSQNQFKRIQQMQSRGRNYDQRLSELLLRKRDEFFGREASRVLVG